MTITQLDSAGLKSFLLGGCARLAAHKEDINDLNVFPVPDGDTGINMYLTVRSAEEKIEALPESATLGEIADAFSMGTLMGARGNSGVILSQIFRGIATALHGKKKADAKLMARAFRKGVDLSYRSVMKPAEGTILTVNRCLADAAEEAAAANPDLEHLLTAALAAAEEALARTPEQLPVLKEAGVVDAGGMGLTVFLRGGIEVLLHGVELPPKTNVHVEKSAPSAGKGPAAARTDISTADILYTYCTQVCIKGEKIPVDRIRRDLAKDPPGDSLMVVGDKTLVKIHYHNNHPGRVLEYCAQYGSLHDIMIDNMRDQHHENMAAAELENDENAPLSGVVAVCAGEGMEDLFRELGAEVISGGQTMNPSAEDLLSAVKANRAKEIIILPNNSNIILTAEQVKKMSDKPVSVIHCKHVPAGISSMLSFNQERSAEENARAMESAAKKTLSGEITFAVRESKFNGFDIHENDLLAISEGKIIATGGELRDALINLIEYMIKEKAESELISLYAGGDLAAEEIETLTELVRNHFSEHEVELHQGGQPLYYFLIGIE